MAQKNENHTQKKTIKYKEACEEKKKEFLKTIKKYESDRLCWIDESGVCERIHRTSCRAPRGEKVFEDVQGKRTARWNIIAGLMKKKLKEAIYFKGTCDSKMFTHWFSKILVPSCPKKTVFILDNAAFHKKKELTKIAEERDCEILFLPPYSPDLNKIEHYWHKLKSKIKTTRKTFPDDFEKALQTSLMAM